MKVVENPIKVMKRTELKFLLSPAQTKYIIEAIADHMQPDEYGLTPIASLYYDTPDRRLIAESIQKPRYKEKIRVRSYGPATAGSPVFLELKRKCKGEVYKRRIATDLMSVERFFKGGSPLKEADLDPATRKYCVNQIAGELEYFRDFYGNLKPSCMIICDRLAYFEPNGDLRITLDFDPRFRFHDLDLSSSMEGESLLPAGWTIMEIKVQQAMPLWLCRILSEGKIYKTSFSKYGEAYKRMMSQAEAAPGEEPAGLRNAA